ncbi:ZIP family metal transporter [Haladaptatus sp. W1]|uniref:ZIP family metal transporter n=1 Tax=Haladaptatus sp. W1 TaxID=1897478 RepID=UPI000A68BE50|nr:ZIP family metal transporter [Haladaptatus sp. W1]
MTLLANLVLVFIAGLITALATGIGALPFFLVKDVNDRWNVGLWGLASGIMVSASVFGLISEGLSSANGGSVIGVVIGMLVGVALVVVSDYVISGTDVNPKKYEQADFKKLILILGVLTVHSFPEGVAIGVSFADLGFQGGYQFAGFVVPLLAIFMTIAISIHNIPEGVAISIPLHSMGVRKWRMVWWSIFSSLPQPIGAVIAFYFGVHQRERRREHHRRGVRPRNPRTPPRDAADRRGHRGRQTAGDGDTRARAGRGVVGAPLV